MIQLINPRAKLLAEMAATIHAGECADHENYNKDDVSVALKSAETILTDIERDHGVIFQKVNTHGEG